MHNSLPLRLLYHVLRFIVRLSLWVFYPASRIRHRERLVFDGPAIVAGNHPNTLLDPLLAVHRSSRQAAFLANAKLFASAAGQLLNTFYCIPIERPTDVEGRRIQNKDSFRKAYEHLWQGGMIYVAPEGYSLRERRVREVKTGAARILLAAEAAKDFTLGSQLIPVGVNYEHPSLCGSRTLIRVGEPIRTADYQTTYAQDERAAVRAMTTELQTRLEGLVLQTRTDEESDLLRILQTIWQHSEPVDVETHHLRSQDLLRRLQDLHDTNPGEYAALEQRATRYCTAVAEAGLTDAHVSDRFRGSDLPALLLGGIPAWYGWFNHYLMLAIPRWTEARLKLDKSYRATVKYMVGLFTFPLFYFLQFQLVDEFVAAPWAWLYLLSLPLTGWWARWYWRWARVRWAGLRFRGWRSGHSAQAEALVQQRERLLGYVLRGRVDM